MKLSELLGILFPVIQSCQQISFHHVTAYTFWIWVSLVCGGVAGDSVFQFNLWFRVFRVQSVCDTEGSFCSNHPTRALPTN